MCLQFHVASCVREMYLQRSLQMHVACCVREIIFFQMNIVTSAIDTVNQPKLQPS